MSIVVNGVPVVLSPDPVDGFVLVVGAHGLVKVTARDPVEVLAAAVPLLLPSHGNHPAPAHG